MFRLFPVCSRCNTSHFFAFLKNAHYVCSKCGYHLRLDAPTRLKLICDKRTFVPFNKNLKSVDVLNFPKYRDKLEKSIQETKTNEAIITGTCEIKGHAATIGVMEPNFIMASMGSAVGEKIARQLECSVETGIPAIIIISSGGARMQEGIFSLMQMAKTSAAVRLLNDHGLPLFTVLTDPTTGGVTASFAMLGNVIIAESEALIGFAGPRVIEQTIGQTLPQGFQRSEFLLEHGMLDMIVPRKQLRHVLGTLLHLHAGKPYKAR